MGENDARIADIIKKNCYCILCANITENTYEIIWKGDYFTQKENRFGDLSKLWNRYMNKENVYGEDLSDFYEYANLDFISEYLRKYHGQENFEFEFRRNLESVYKPIRVEIIPTAEYENENQSVYIVVKLAGNKNREDYVRLTDLLSDLSENYGAIFYVDFEKDIVRPFRMNDIIEQVFGKTFRAHQTYEEAMNAYIDSIIVERDREEMHTVTKHEFLKEQLANARSYSHEYGVERNGRMITFRFKIANLDGIGELRRAVIGFADVSAEKANDYTIYKPGQKILIVEEPDGYRDNLCSILETEYDVLVASNGKAAIEMLEEHHDDIAIVLADLFMTAIDGYEFIKEMKRARQYSNIPFMIIADSDFLKADDESDVRTLCLELGAADFVMKPFNSDIVLNRIKSIIQLTESTNMLTKLETDSLTGLYTKEFFFSRVEKYLKENPEEDCIMWVSDITGLKAINEKYGIEMGDLVIKCQADNKDLIKGFILGGRIEGDKFGALIDNNYLEDLKKIISISNMGIKFPLSNIVIKHGLYHIRKKSTLPPRGMYDRALLALQKIKDTYGVYWSEYDDVLRKDLLTQRQIAENAEESLKGHQFKVFYQPKYDIRNEMTSGAEALIRWIHPELGFMNPGIFIPLFERNGFIKELDLYVWEEVCKSLKEWKDKGIKRVPISVNVSRRDFEIKNLAKRIVELVDKYEIEHSYFHIEVTESSYADNPDLITQTIKEFHDNGFIVELDDFGAGYSSMSALSELDIDVMKLDMSIIKKDNPDSGKSILEFSMQLAKMMKLKTVAEGVETIEQVNRISSLGGDYIQGYYYSKPLPKEEFEEYLRNEQQNI